MTKSRTLPLSKRGMNFETLMWYFTRLSALAMYAFILFGMIGALLMGARNQMNFADVMRWAFNSNAHHVHSTDLVDMTPWETPLWKLTAIGFFMLAAAHGMHGLVVIADDYIPGAGARKVVRLLSIVMLASVTVIGVYVLWTS